MRSFFSSGFSALSVLSPVAAVALVFWRPGTWSPFSHCLFWPGGGNISGPCLIFGGREERIARLAGGAFDMAHEFKTQRRVTFADTDCAGIAHFSGFFRYMEDAEHEFLRSLGLSVQHESEDGSVVGFPRISAHCEFSRAVRFEDVVDIHLWLSGRRKSVLEYSFRLSCEGQEVAIGELVVIACRVTPDPALEVADLPAPFADQLEVAPYEPLEFRSRTGKQSGGDS